MARICLANISTFTLLEALTIDNADLDDYVGMVQMHQFGKFPFAAPRNA